jgi:hypothetical protein
MGTKNNPGKFDCYANAGPDEPIFILLGRDPHAHLAVRKWARDRRIMIRNGLKPETDREMTFEAERCADQMQLFSQAWSDNKNKRPSGAEEG